MAHASELPEVDVTPPAILELSENWGVQVEAEDAFNAKNVATGLKFRVKMNYRR